MHADELLSSRIVLVVAALVAGLGTMPRGARAGDGAQPEPRVYKDAEGNSLPYLLLVPENYDPSKRYPLVMFYHGVGERGDDNAIQWTNGVEVFQTPENRRVFPCFVVAPQCPVDQQWVDVPWVDDSEVQPAEPTPSLRMSLEIVDALQKEFHLDADRLYVTGLSMGGFAVWDVITRYPQRFAAAVPVCGGGDETKANVLIHLPIWAFHGALNQTVKPQRSRNMIAAILKAGGDKRRVKYTEYPNVGHDAWTLAYQEPNLLPWLFGQKRPGKPPRTPASR